jgi:hypothetical protein
LYRIVDRSDLSVHGWKLIDFSRFPTCNDHRHDQCVITQVGYIAPENFGILLHGGQVLSHPENPNANLIPNRRGNKHFLGGVSVRLSLGRGKGGARRWGEGKKKGQGS